jgi:hypothetical protein
MNKDKVQKLICKLELVLEGLKEELFDENPMSNYQYEEVVPYIDDYDEVYYGEEDHV